MCWRAKVDMELLAEFNASRSPNYKHGTPDGVQQSKCPNSSHNFSWWCYQIVIIGNRWFLFN